jgi:hypothetical protein
MEVAPATTGGGSSRFWKEVARVSNKLLKMASVNAQNNKSHIIEVSFSSNSNCMVKTVLERYTVSSLRNHST